MFVVYSLLYFSTIESTLLCDSIQFVEKLMRLPLLQLLLLPALCIAHAKQFNWDDVLVYGECIKMLFSHSRHPTMYERKPIFGVETSENTFRMGSCCD